MDSKKVMLHLIRAGRDALHLDTTLTELGYRDTPYFTIGGDIADAITYLLDENPETFEESSAYAAIHDIYTTDEQCAENLAERINHGPQIRESTMDFLREVAEERRMNTNQLISLILSDWARKEILFRETFCR